MAQPLFSPHAQWRLRSAVIDPPNTGHLEEHRRHFSAGWGAEGQGIPRQSRSPHSLAESQWDLDPEDVDDLLADLAARAEDERGSPMDYNAVALEAVQLGGQAVQPFRGKSTAQDAWILKQLDNADTAQLEVLATCGTAALHVAETDWAATSRSWARITVRTVFRTLAWLRMEEAVDAVKGHVERGRPHGVADHAWRQLKANFFEAILHPKSTDEAWDAFEPMIVAATKERHGAARYSIGQWSQMLKDVDDHMLDLARRPGYPW